MVLACKRLGTEIATTLNNMDVSSEYVLKLKHEIEEMCGGEWYIFFSTLQLYWLMKFIKF